MTRRLIVASKQRTKCKQGQLARIDKRQARTLLSDPGFKGEVLALPCNETMSSDAPYAIHIDRDRLGCGYTFEQCVTDETRYHCDIHTGRYLAFYVEPKYAKALA